MVRQSETRNEKKYYQTDVISVVNGMKKNRKKKNKNRYENTLYRMLHFL